MMGWEYDRALDCKPKIEIQDVNTTILSCSIVKCIKYFKAYKNTWQIIWPKKHRGCWFSTPKKYMNNPPPHHVYYKYPTWDAASPPLNSWYLPALPCICMYCLCLCSRQNHPLGNLWTSHFSYSYPFTSHFCLMALFALCPKHYTKLLQKHFLSPPVWFMWPFEPLYPPFFPSYGFSTYSTPSKSICASSPTTEIHLATMHVWFVSLQCFY